MTFPRALIAAGILVILFHRAARAQLPVAAPTALERPIVVVDASPLLVSTRCQYPDLGSYGVAYSGVRRVSRQLCTDSLFDP